MPFFLSCLSCPVCPACLSCLSCPVYAITKMQVMCCGAVCFAISPHNTYLQGELGRYTPSPPWPSHTPVQYNYLYDKACRGELCSPLAGGASSPLSLPLVRVSLRLTHPARVSYTQPGTIYLRCWCWQLGRASPPTKGGEIAQVYLRTLYAV